MKREDRRLLQHQEVKQSILDAAREIARTEGWRNVTMRKIAEHIEYSHPMLYAYFANKEVLLLELMREGFRLQLLGLQASQAQATDPHESVKRMAQAYWDFAWQYPELYRVMNGLDGVSFSADDAQTEGQKVSEIGAVLIKAIRLQHGEIAADAYIDTQIHLLWSGSHGIISLTMAGRIAGGKEQAWALYEQMVNDALQRWDHSSPAQ